MNTKFNDIISLFKFIKNLTADDSPRLTEAPTPTEHIRVNILGIDDSTVKFKIRPNIKFQKLAETYSQLIDMPRDGLRFRLDGNAIQDDDLVGSILASEDTIEVFAQQIGGSDPNTTSDSTSSSENQIKGNNTNGNPSTITDAPSSSENQTHQPRTILCEPSNSDEPSKYLYKSCNARYLRMKKAREGASGGTVPALAVPGASIYLHDPTNQKQYAFNKTAQCELCYNKMQHNEHTEAIRDINRRLSCWETQITSNREYKNQNAQTSSTTPNRPLQIFTNIERLLKNTASNITISLEGNIGAGKSTLIKKLKKLGSPNITTLREPLEKWREFHNMNLLDAAYKNPKKWAMAFQTHVITTMAKNHLEKATVKIMERSMESITNVFIQAHQKQGKVPTIQCEILLELIELINSQLPTFVNAYVYLRTEPAVAYQRLKQRQRAEERDISLDYLQLIHELHEKWLYTKANPRVITIDANQNIEHITRELNMKIGKLQNLAN